MEPDRNTVDAILEAIERRELRSLRWGYADGSFSEEDLDILTASVVGSGGDVNENVELTEWMVKHCLLFESHDDGNYRYRSRFGEGVRLLTRLKQLMPNRPWVTSPDLVSDYRVDARPRRVPKRDLSLAECLQQIPELSGTNNFRMHITEAFIGDRLLSGFQVRATQAILRPAPQDRGTVLTAGTGSGKTLAFYLPAALELGPLLREGAFWTKVVAVFPRIELLKDQFTQAYALLSPLGPILRQEGGRPFRLGTFFSGTPREASADIVGAAGWALRGQGNVCPFLLCPRCGGELLWLHVHMNAGSEILTCAEDCGAVIGEDEIVLTRERARREPPDIVFTTAETINQRLSDTSNRHVLGISSDPKRRARFILLDEIHTYGGTSGAQTALVLRRWRHAIGYTDDSVRYVGLSATLEDASRFFSELTGLFPSLVTSVLPRDDELTSQSMEYQIVLRGDPTSHTALLSTTVQASFLMARLLDLNASTSTSEGRFGSRVFAFTDDLDATNRLFDILRDAEARNIYGNPDGARTPLATLRASNQPDRRLRVLAGQDWSHLERLGRPLSQRLVISRTSSQDRGVDWSSDIIVATSALEVGFNDSTVGAIVQHKAPHQLSSYVQRKGRAGRIPTMRPWTVTVLSDYGRDRQLYESYDRLFDPILRPNTLPIRNRYVLRMQAAFATLDWLASTNLDLPGWWWQPLNGPTDRDGLWLSQQKRASAILEEILRGPGALRQGLSNHVRRALRLETQDYADEILWGPPRSLILEVLPTLARRLESDWKLNAMITDAGSTDLFATGLPHPLPDFLPPNLFSDLNLPEVSVVLPSDRIERMPIVQALSRLAPGRVTRRFAPERGKLNHWVPVPLMAGEHPLIIGDYFESSELVARIPVELNGVVREIPCYRPWKIRLQLASERDVKPTSNAWQQWRTQLMPTGQPITLSTEHDPRWGSTLQGIDFFMHAFQAPVTIRRFVLEAHANVKLPGPNQTDIAVVTRYLGPDGSQAAVGFEQESDAVLVRLQLPDRDTLAERATTAKNLPSWRRAYFRDVVLNDPELSSICNWFQRDWLQQMMLAVLIDKAVSLGSDLPSALSDLLEDDLGANLRDVATRILGMDIGTIEEDDEEIPSDLDHSAHGPQLDLSWEDLLRDDIVLRRLVTLAAELWAPTLDTWSNWLWDRTKETLGEALLAAAFRAAPAHISEDSLLLDLDRGATHDEPIHKDEVWLTESALGGSGAIEALARGVTDDPRLLIRGLEAEIAPNDVELTALGLEALIEEIEKDAVVTNAVEDVRQHLEHDERVLSLKTLYGILSDRGFAIDLGLKIAMNHRILREGTGASSDKLLLDLIRQWRTWENRFGVSIGLNMFALIATGSHDLGPRIRELLQRNAPGRMTESEAASVLAGFLWPRTEEVRTMTFQSYGPFRGRGHTDPSLVRELLLGTGPEPVIFGAPGWKDQFAASLASWIELPLPQA